MTFTALQQQTSYSDFNEVHDPTPIGTDEAEYRRYTEVMGETPADDYTDDLIDGGFVADPAEPISAPYVFG